eukprot:TRINITY_DN273_c0_g1_i1.p1 TRINITY_DN273_c0_g1~~TRINITY_DN273_c0_g1_i1.p1  ORF type:complete len:322 (+),score=121.43 TRINITY_DN273_c0_g1_i1:152-1117(+)
MADLKANIKKQIEFYFGDSNYPRDKFMRASAAQSPEGFITIETLLKFNRLKDLTTDVKAIVEAVKDSTIVSANAEGTAIKRTAPLPETNTSLERTIYAKGFTEGYTLEDAEKFFQKFGEVKMVKIRRDKEKKPKPSVFVEFATEEQAKAALAAKPLKYGENELLMYSKKEYMDLKKAEIQKKKDAKKAEKPQKDNKNSKNKEEAPKKDIVLGCLVSFKGIGTEDVNRHTLKDIFAKFGNVKFVDHKNGESEGIIRFADPESAKKAISEMKEKIGGKVPELKTIEGAAEEEYQNKINEAAASQGKRKSGGGRGGRGGKRRRF